jgi:(E)-4-hydroxy-3-methylbut-2-enyl-diphosphate synthase
LSIIGCVVNGPGEMLMTDIGGTGRHIIYRAGKTDHTMAAGGVVEHIVEPVEAKAAELKARTLVTEALAAE